jgi:hypothetical protein
MANNAPNRAVVRLRDRMTRRQREKLTDVRVFARLPQWMLEPIHGIMRETGANRQDIVLSALEELLSGQ